MGVRELLNWLADRLPFVPDLPPETDEADRRAEQRVTEKADRVVQRAGRVTDKWDEYIRLGRLGAEADVITRTDHPENRPWNER